MSKTKTEFVYTMSEVEAYEKMQKWYGHKKNLVIFSCIPKQTDDKGYEVTFSYDDE